jgi:S1-C subfamily serine protease/Flp pilus assembly protein TadD
MFASRRPMSHRLLWRATDRTTLATSLAICLLLTAVSRASDKAIAADTPTGNESAASQQSAADSHALFDAIRKLFDGSQQLSPEELYERVAPSVVTVYSKDENGELICSGSGFFIDVAPPRDRHDLPSNYELFAKYIGDDKSVQGAYVLTNYHVIRPAAFVDLALHNGNVGHAPCILAEDEKADLALLLVSVPAFQMASASAEIFPRVKVKRIPLALNDPHVMTTVYAIGSPVGLSGTASEGKVSAYREFDGERWLQTTAPISPGSSGGPLLLADGTLVGVTTLTKTEGQNLNFAIPASAVRSFLATTKFRPRHPYEGTSIHLQEEMAFAEMNDAVKSKRSNNSATDTITLLQQSLKNDAEREAAATLSDARRELEKRPARDGDSLDHYQKVVASAQEAGTSLSGEFQYLMHYVVGKANICAATCAEPGDANDAPRMESDQIRYRVSRYAKDAYDHLTKAVELNPDFPATYGQLYQHHRLSGNWADALLTSDKLVKLMPRCGEALAMRAECYHVLGQPDSARKDLEAATDLSPANANLHYQLARLLAESGEYQDAIESYEEALACDAPDLRDTLHYHLGIVYRKSGNVEKAITEFTNAKAFGWSADVCDSQIAECRQLEAHPAVMPHRHAQTIQARQIALHPQQSTVYVTKPKQ